MQREFASRHEKVVTEGRDQGTVVFPDADYKFYLNADIEERARRRLNDLSPSDKIDLEQMKQQINDRDKSDEQREVAPLKQADDAIEIDTTNLDQQQVVQILLGYIEKNGY
jgi:cytidylate kinase